MELSIALPKKAAMEGTKRLNDFNDEHIIKTVAY